jgi:hypothetical protein
MFRFAKYDVAVVGIIVGGYFTFRPPRCVYPHAHLRFPEEGSERCSRNAGLAKYDVAVVGTMVDGYFSSQAYPNIWI